MFIENTRKDERMKKYISVCILLVLLSCLIYGQSGLDNSIGIGYRTNETKVALIYKVGFLEKMISIGMYADISIPEKLLEGTHDNSLWYDWGDLILTDKTDIEMSIGGYLEVYYKIFNISNSFGIIIADYYTSDIIQYYDTTLEKYWKANANVENKVCFGMSYGIQIKNFEIELLALNNKMIGLAVGYVFDF